MPDKTKDEHGYTPDNYQPLPNKEAIVHFNGKTLLTAESYLDVKAYEHALAFTVAGLMDEDLLKDVRDAVASAMENGTDFREFKRTLKPYLMAKGWLAETLDDGTQQLVAGSNRRLRTIYSTNLQTAYSAGQRERIQQTKEFLPYLQYMPSVSENPRLSHKRYYGLCRPADDAIWQSIMPPNGWGCKCWVKQLTKRQAQKVGISEEKPLEMEDYKNPKTGEVSKVPVGVDPSFAHNHDRFTALIRSAEDKHGRVFANDLAKNATIEQLNLMELGMVRKVESDGRRNEVALTDEQINEVKEVVALYNLPELDVRFSESNNTGYKDLFDTEILYIGTDVYPSLEPTHKYPQYKANNSLSMQAAIAHELVGHRDAEIAGKTHADDLFEEVQASIRAAMYGKKLTMIDKIMLLRDAIERLHNNDLKVSDIRNKLWLEPFGGASNE